MKLRESTSLALKYIRSNKLRTALTIIIIAIGISAIVGIQTAIDGLKNYVNDDFASMGSNSFNIQWSRQAAEGDGASKPSGPVLYREAELFKKNFTDMALVSTSTSASWMAQFKYQGKKTNPNVTVLGVDENYLSIGGYRVAKGREFSRIEIEAAGQVALLGSEIAEVLFGDNINPINKFVTYKGMRLRVVGVLESKGQSFMTSDKLVMLPLKTVRTFLITGQTNYDIGVRVARPEQLQHTIDDATGLFRQIRQLRPTDPNNFIIQRSDSMATELMELLKNLSVGAMLIGIFTLFGAAVALMNIMLVSVNERTREIGINMALGALRKDIRRQFLTESIVICLIGGMTGITMGILLGNIVAQLIGASFVIPWFWMALAIILCVIVGLGAGIYPAIKAGRLDPVEAMRYE